MRVSIIGGAGHVGLPLGVTLADSGYEVVLIDQDEVKLERIREGQSPFNEPGMEPLLKTAIEEGRITTSVDFAPVDESDVVIIVVGTPIDKHYNPDMENLMGVIDGLLEHLEDQLLLLRSTVYPGTTGLVRKRLERNGHSVGDGIGLAFTPERVAQHNALEEIVELPQLVGAFDESSRTRATAFFESFISAECLDLTPTEAEIGKLFTNMWRYISFAVANEFHLIVDSFTDTHDVNVHRILDQTSEDYPRFDVPRPGPNVGGPCLTKDGWFLVDNIPYNEFVNTSYQINEGMPAQMVQRMKSIVPDPKKVTVLGMTFKANSDDTRNSVSFKLTKRLRREGIPDIKEVDPNLDDADGWETVAGSDWVILMTPHDEFEDLPTILDHVDNPDCVYCDIWGLWGEMKYRSDNGYFRGREAER